LVHAGETQKLPDSSSQAGDISVEAFFRQNSSKLNIPMAYPWYDMVLLLILPFVGGDDMFLRLLPLEKRHNSIMSMGDLQDPKMEVLYHIRPYELWGYSLKLRPEI